MPRGPAKHPSDSTPALLKAARQADTSTAQAPRDLPGTEFLDDFGFGVLDTYYRERPEWTAADLALIVLAANATQQLRDARREIEALGLIVTTKTTTKPNPMLAVSEALSNQIQKCLQGAGLRQRDGQRPSQAAATPEAGPTTGGETVSFEDFLRDLAK